MSVAEYPSIAYENNLMEKDFRLKVNWRLVDRQIIRYWVIRTIVTIFIKA